MSTLYTQIYQQTAEFSKFGSHAFHGWDGIASGVEPVLCESLTPEDRRFGDGRQFDVVVWTGEVQEAKTVNMLLVFGGDGNPEIGRAHV